jgi:hypothetical protein
MDESIGKGSMPNTNKRRKADRASTRRHDGPKTNTTNRNFRYPATTPLYTTLSVSLALKNNNEN